MWRWESWHLNCLAQLISVVSEEDPWTQTSLFLLLSQFLLLSLSFLLLLLLLLLSLTTKSSNINTSRSLVVAADFYSSGHILFERRIMKLIATSDCQEADGRCQVVDFQMAGDTVPPLLSYKKGLL